MTENLAGRGEGLAERILAMDAKLHDGQALVEWDDLVAEARAALEAAAPAGTARTVGCTASDDCIHECPVSEPESRLDEFKTTVIALWDPELTPEQKKVYIASRGKELREAAALATPSPQAPQEQSNAFSTTSAREQAAGSEAGTALADEILLRIARRYENSSVNIYPDMPCLTPVEAVLRCAREEGFVLSSIVPGSPRKVGEDGATQELAGCLKDLSELWQATQGDSSAEKCMRHCGEVLEHELEIHGFGPSSVPVGEQKQEEGVESH